jgi:uncharacterized membrane protein YfcA
VSISVLLLLTLGAAVGFLSGLFGVGGGFLLTPLLIFIGIPPAVAVATQSNQVVASSVSGVMVHWGRGNVDLMMGITLLAGGVVGSSIGIVVFSLLKHFGQIDVVIAVAYVVTLGAIGVMMMVESIQALRRVRRKAPPRKLHQHTWIHGLPFKLRFKKSRLYISAILPVGIGAVVGLMSAIMGVGGAFMLVPAMIYMLGMPTSVVVGTSLFQIIFVSGYVTILQSWENHTVDILLALLLTVGSVVGAQVGGRIGVRLPGEQLRFLLALLIVVMAALLLIELVRTPAELYSIVTLGISR